MRVKKGRRKRRREEDGVVVCRRRNPRLATLDDATMFASSPPHSHTFDMQEFTRNKYVSNLYSLRMKF